MGDVIVVLENPMGYRPLEFRFKGAFQAGTHFKDKEGVELKMCPEGLNRNIYVYLDGRDVDSLLSVLGIERPVK